MSSQATDSRVASVTATSSYDTTQRASVKDGTFLLISPTRRSLRWVYRLA